MLTGVVREIERNLQHYKDYEELSRITTGNAQMMESATEIVSVMEKIEKGIDFFRENFEFKKAEMYLRRFETMR